MLFLLTERNLSPAPTYGVPPMRDNSPWTSPTWVHPLGNRSANCCSVGHCSMGCSPARTGCSSVGPPRCHKSYQETCCSTGSSLHRSAAPCSSVGFPWGHSPLSNIHLLQHRSVSSVGCRWIPAPPDLHGLQGHPSSRAWSTPCPCFSSDLGVYRAVPLTYSHSCSSVVTITILQWSFFVSNLLSERPYHFFCLAQSGPAAGLSRAG